MKLSLGRLLGASVALFVASGSGVRASEDAPQAALQQEDFDPSSRTNLRRAEGTTDIIVVLKDDAESRARHLNQGKRPEIAAANKAKAAAVAQGLGVQPTFTYGSATYGFSAKGVTAAQKAAIEDDPRVLYTEEDAIIHLDPTEMTPSVRQLVALDEGDDFVIDPMEAADDEILQPSPLRQGHRKLATPVFTDMSPDDGAAIGNSQQFTFKINTSPDLLRTVSFTIVYPNGNTQSFTPGCSGGGGTYSCGITISGFSGGTWGWRVYAKDNVRQGGGNSATSPTRDMTYGGGGGCSASCLDNSGSGQIVPWGIHRVMGGQTYAGPKVAYVMDTGVALGHPDLNIDVSRGYNAFTSGRDGRSLDDGHGHGTHVAGTIGAIDNDEGVVGVAAGVHIVPIKVLSSSGSGYTSGIVAGIDHIMGDFTSGDVVNMSLGGGISQSLDNAVWNAAAAGVLFALAAGNESDDANSYSPARVNHGNVFTVSAMDSCDKFAGFSNFGSGVDIAAPGVGVLSSSRSGGTRSMNGTSMAAPHIAGLLIHASYSNGNTVVNTDGNVCNDPDGTADAIGSK